MKKLTMTALALAGVAVVALAATPMLLARGTGAGGGGPLGGGAGAGVGAGPQDGAAPTAPEAVRGNPEGGDAGEATGSTVERQKQNAGAASGAVAADAFADWQSRANAAAARPSGDANTSSER